MKRKSQTPCSPDQEKKRKRKKRKIQQVSVSYNGLDEDNFLLFEITTKPSVKGKLLQIDIFVKKDKNTFKNVISLVPIMVEEQIYRIAVDFIPFVLTVDMNIFFPSIEDNGFFFENTKKEEIIPTIVSKYVRTKLNIPVIDECITDNMEKYGIETFVLHIRMTILSKEEREIEKYIDVVQIKPFD